MTSLLDQAAAGSGSALLLHGAAGIGKTTLLDQAQRLAARREMRTLTCSGVRAEARLPFAGLHQLLRPVLGLAAGLPAEQRDLLRAALGLDENALADLYRVALAALELLAVVAAQAPLLVVADDAHWLDRASADVLAFAGRRIAAEPMSMLFSSRDGADNPFEGSGIPDLAVSALDPDSSRALLDRVAPQLKDEVRDRLLADAAGNPLALTELPATLRPDEPLPDRLPVGDLLRRSFTTRLSELPGRTQTLLLVISADSGCRLGELCAAATIVDGSPVREADIQPAIDARLVRLVRPNGDKVTFCHPLIAAAIYQSATVGERQQVHTTLARVIPAGDDRRVWHLAAAALGPDDSVARELEALADRATRRGAVTVTIAALDRASSLVTDKAREAELLLRSSECAVELGRGALALDLASRADVGQLKPTGPARLLIIREAVNPGVSGSGVAVADFIEAASAVAAAGEADLAAATLWTAASRCWWTSAGAGDRLGVAAATQALDLPAADPRRIAILAYTVTADRRPELHGHLLQACAERRELTSLRFMASAAANLGDHALAVRLFSAAVKLARTQGRLGVIARLQALQAWSTLWSGDLDAAAMLADETGRLAGEQNQPMWHGAAMLELALVRALRGDYPQAKEELWRQLASGENRDVRLYRAMAIYGLSVAALGVGRYAEAYEYLRRIVDPADDLFHYGACQWIIADLAEAAVGAGHVADSAELLAGLAAELREHPAPAVRYAVLFADAIRTDDGADASTVMARFQTALTADPGGGELNRARLRLAYGSWLRRHRRMREARDVLAAAQETFTRLGTSGFAYRAARELRAAGGAGRPHGTPGLAQLTPQELQIAQLAAQGLSNRQIGGQLFLSHRTVGSHLYHLFPKLGITTRSQLADVLARTSGLGGGTAS